jgi:hypothetical protein
MSSLNSPSCSRPNFIKEFSMPNPLLIDSPEWTQLLNTFQQLQGGQNGQGMGQAAQGMGQSFGNMGQALGNLGQSFGGWGGGNASGGWGGHAGGGGQSALNPQRPAGFGGQPAAQGMGQGAFNMPQLPAGLPAGMPMGGGQGGGQMNADQIALANSPYANMKLGGTQPARPAIPAGDAAPGAWASWSAANPRGDGRSW